MIRSLVFITIILSAWGASPKLPKATKEPGKISLDGERLMKEGVKLHDRADYDGAIEKFERVLGESPDSTVAMYELSNSLMAAKQYQKSLDMARRGAEYQSNLLAGFYTIIGSTMDELGDRAGAVEVYREAMKANPREAMLPFNLGITLERMNRMDEARASYESALRLNPNHASSHFRLGALFQKSGFGLPAVLAYLRFLELSQDQARNEHALQYVLNRMMGGATEGKAPNQINVIFNVKEEERKEEGDFSGVAVMISLGSAMRFTEEGKKMTRPQQVQHQLEFLMGAFESNKELKKEKKKFAATYYGGYFGKLTQAKHMEAFTNWVLRQTKWPEVGEWLKQNEAALEGYGEWSRGYDWGSGAGGRR